MMNKLCNILSFLALFSIIQLACDSGKLSPIKYKEWMEKPQNGMIKQIVKNNYTFSLQYETTDYVIVNEEKSNSIPKTKYKRRKSELDNFIHFKLKILDKEGKNVFASTSDSTQQYCYFGMQHDLVLVNSTKDTIPCNMYLFENHGGIGPDEYIAAFEDINKTRDQGFTFIYDAHNLHVEKICFNYNSDLLKQVPHLKTN